MRADALVKEAQLNELALVLEDLRVAHLLVVREEPDPSQAVRPVVDAAAVRAKDRRDRAELQPAQQELGAGRVGGVAVVERIEAAEVV